MTQILIFGDSIAYGAWDLEGGWAQRLRRFLDKKVIDSQYEEYYITYNLGIDGDTSTGLLKRFEVETKPRIWPGEETIFFFHIGDNDSLYNNKTKKFLVPTDKFEKNIKELISQSKKHSEKIIFIGSAPIDDSKTDPVPLIPDSSYKNKYFSRFREITKKICEKENCHFIDLSNTINQENWKNFLPDGVHPNTEGYEKTFEVIKDHLIKNKII